MPSVYWCQRNSDFWYCSKASWNVNKYLAKPSTLRKICTDSYLSRLSYQTLHNLHMPLYNDLLPQTAVMHHWYCSTGFGSCGGSTKILENIQIFQIGNLSKYRLKLLTHATALVNWIRICNFSTKVGRTEMKKYTQALDYIASLALARTGINVPLFNCCAE